MMHGPLPGIGSTPLPVLRGRRAGATETLALVLIALMVSLPFLLPHHRNPIPTFFSEWWAALFGLLAAGVLLRARYREHFSLPTTALMPTALAGLILLQLGLVPATRSDASLLAVLYLLWTIVLMATAASLIREHGPQRLANALALGIAGGALASTLAMVLQATDVLRGSGLISPLIGNRLFANLNQPNHLALLLWLGVVALIRLADQRLLRTPAALAAIACLVPASLFTGSRAVLPYALALPLFALWQHRKNGSARAMLPLATAAFLIALLAHFAQPWLVQAPTFATLAERDWSGKSGDGIRAGLWWMALQLGGDNLLAGIGWGRFSSQTFEGIIDLRQAAPGSLQLVPAEHAHNIGLHLYAELGLPATLLIGALFVAWAVRTYRFARHHWTSEMAFSVALLLLLALHAQIEYTLWYAFFLGIAAIALTLSDPGRLPLPRPRFALTGLVLLASLSILLMLRHDYERLEDAMQWPLAKEGKPLQPWSEVMAELVDLRQRSRFGSYVDLTLAGAMKLDREGIADKLIVCNKAITFSPTHYAVFKCAALQALNGEAAPALDRMHRALLAYPEYAGDFVRSGTALMAEFPELQPLIDAANNVVEERRPAKTKPAPVRLPT